MFVSVHSFSRVRNGWREIRTENISTFTDSYHISRVFQTQWDTFRKQFIIDSTDSYCSLTVVSVVMERKFTNQ